MFVLTYDEVHGGLVSKQPCWQFLVPMGAPAYTITILLQEHLNLLGARLPGIQSTDNTPITPLVSPPNGGNLPTYGNIFWKPNRLTNKSG